MGQSNMCSLAKMWKQRHVQKVMHYKLPLIGLLQADRGENT